MYTVKYIGVCVTNLFLNVYLCLLRWKIKQEKKEQINGVKRTDLHRTREQMNECKCINVRIIARLNHPFVSSVQRFIVLDRLIVTSPWQVMLPQSIL